MPEVSVICARNYSLCGFGKDRTDSGRLVGNAEVIREPCSLLSRPELASGKLAGHFKSQQLNRLGLPRYGPAVRATVSGKLNPLKKTTFYDFRVSDVYKCPVFGARGNGYDVSEVKDRRDRSNELYEQVAALG